MIAFTKALAREVCDTGIRVNCVAPGPIAAEILRHIYGESRHFITLSNPAVPDIVLQYTTFKQITDDISDARVYGGIHFRTDQVAGERLGKAIGKAVYRNNLRRTRHDD